MKIVKRVFPVVLVFAMLFCTFFSLCTVSASAATTSSGTQSRTITVKTKANYWLPGSESITIGQSKGTCVKKTYNFFTGKMTQKSSNQYGEWDITVKATDGSHSFKKTLTGSSIKLKLKPNKTYKITITWDSQAALFKTLDKGDYTKYPTWRVKSTWKVSNYY